eukprot:436503-Pelagomonas_calceolata.AAC.3
MQPSAWGWLAENLQRVSRNELWERKKGPGYYLKNQKEPIHTSALNDNLHPTSESCKKSERLRKLAPCRHTELLASLDKQLSCRRPVHEAVTQSGKRNSGKMTLEWPVGARNNAVVLQALPLLLLGISSKKNPAVLRQAERKWQIVVFYTFCSHCRRTQQCLGKLNASSRCEDGRIPPKRTWRYVLVNEVGAVQLQIDDVVAARKVQVSQVITPNHKRLQQWVVRNGEG